MGLILVFLVLIIIDQSLGINQSFKHQRTKNEADNPSKNVDIKDKNRNDRKIKNLLKNQKKTSSRKKKKRKLKAEKRQNNKEKIKRNRTKDRYKKIRQRKQKKQRQKL